MATAYDSRPASQPAALRALFGGLPAALPVLALALFLTWLRPIGYLGGDADDWHYLQAIRCAVEQGYCLPPNHWWQRFPLIAPAALASALLGESIRNLWIVPALYAAAAIMLFVALLNRQFGRPAALIGGFALVLTPVFSDRLLQLGINIPELTFLLAAAFCLQSAVRTRALAWSLAAGLMLALAVQSRATALAALPLFGAALFLSPLGRRDALCFAAGFLAPLGAEAAAYAAAGADPLLPWKLSLAHTSIPSTALEQSVSQGLPLFNIAVIDGWRPTMNISVHWAVDGLLNLLAHPSIGLLLASALALLLVHRRFLLSDGPDARALLFLAAAAALYFGALVYALAIDPKPRMFLPVAPAASAVIGVLAVRGWKAGNRLLVSVCLGALAVKGLVAPYARTDFSPAAEALPAWVAAEGPDLAIDRWTAQTLALSPAAASLPVHRPGAAAPVIRLAMNECKNAARGKAYAGSGVMRSQRFEAAEPPLIGFLRRQGLLLRPKIVPVLCLFATPAGVTAKPQS